MTYFFMTNKLKRIFTLLKCYKQQSKGNMQVDYMWLIKLKYLQLSLQQKESNLL